MSSSEAHYARRMARYYGPDMALAPRAKRLAILRKIIVDREAELQEEHVAHRAECEECRNGAFCFSALSYSPTMCKCHEVIGFVQGLIYHEEQDELYAQRARVHPVEYKNHIDGFCRYWQNLRHRKFASVGWKCERCGSGGPLDAHHLHYDTLGFEELCDLQALCRTCHERADRTRRYSNGLDTYMTKKYGANWDDRIDFDMAEDQFDRWLHQREDYDDDYDDDCGDE